MTSARRVVYVATSAQSLRTFLRDPMHRLRDAGFDVHGVCSTGSVPPETLEADLGLPVHDLPLHRRVAPLADVRSVLALAWRLRRLQVDLVHAHTPKGGLVGMLAAWVARVPARVYTVHGLAHHTRRGWRRRMLVASERLSCRLADRVLCVSPSLRDAVLTERLCSEAKLEVLGNGSAAGVDSTRFDRSPDVVVATARIRAVLGIPAAAPVVGFVGRFATDKGLEELAAAWARLAERFPDWHLLLVGEHDPSDPVPADVLAALESDPRVHHAGWQPDVVAHVATMDLLALPTRREGFGLVLIEAAALGVPTVASAVTGCVDAVVDGTTGLLVPPGDVDALVGALDRVMGDPGLRAALGEAGRRWAVEAFDPELIWSGLLAEYRRLLDPVPT
jgi:glycosyltransferase involved in cell wall biosynthesis